MKSRFAPLLLVFGIVGSVVGQREEVSSTVFYAATTPRRESPRFPLRSKTTEELFSSGVLVKTIVTEFEGTPSTASRETITEVVGDRTTVSVTIEHRDYIYSKVGSDPWQKEKWYFRHPPTETYVASLDGFRYWKETGVVDGSKVTVFGCTGEIELSKGDKSVREDEFYFLGNILIKQARTDRTLEPFQLIRRVTSTSKYDPKIKIEAPIK